MNGNKYTEIFGRKIEMSRKGHVVEEQFGEDKIVFSVWSNAKDFVDNIVNGYDHGLKGLIEDEDAGLYVVYKDGTHWNSRFPENNAEFKRTGIQSAVYDNGWFGYYCYNAVCRKEIDENGWEYYYCDVKEEVAC